MKARCVDIALRATPDSVILVRPRSSLSGRAGMTTGGSMEEPLYEISAPRPFTRHSLYIYLHEIGHVVCDHLRGHPGKENWEIELEAERWAQEKMREEGLAVPRKQQRRAKNYVSWHKAKDKRRAERRKRKRPKS